MVIPVRYRALVALAFLAIVLEMLYSASASGFLSLKGLNHCGDAGGVPAMSALILGASELVPRLRGRLQWQLAAIGVSFAVIAFIEEAHRWGGPFPKEWLIARYQGTTPELPDIAAAGIAALFCCGIVLAHKRRQSSSRHFRGTGAIALAMAMSILAISLGGGSCNNSTTSSKSFISTFKGEGSDVEGVIGLDPGSGPVTSSTALRGKKAPPLFDLDQKLWERQAGGEWKPVGETTDRGLTLNPDNPNGLTVRGPSTPRSPAGRVVYYRLQIVIHAPDTPDETLWTDSIRYVWGKDKP